MAEEKIGVVIHYWSKLSVAGVRLTGGVLKVGDTIHVKGHTSDFAQHVESMHIGTETVDAARAGDEVGIGVNELAREHDEVFKVTEFD
jgi:putative protease